MSITAVVGSVENRDSIVAAITAGTEVIWLLNDGRRTLIYQLGTAGGFGITANPKDINMMKDAFNSQVTPGFVVYGKETGMAQVLVVNSISNPFSGSPEGADQYARQYYENAFAVQYM